MSGGQYSVGRFIFGGHIFLLLVPACIVALRTSPAMDLPTRLITTPANPMYEALVPMLGGLGATVALCLAALASVALAVGWRDGIAAVLLILVLGLIGIGLPFVPYMMLWLTVLIAWLVFHATTKSAPYLSVDAAQRFDPNGGWSLSARHVTSAWILLGCAWVAAALLNLAAQPGSDVLRTVYAAVAGLQLIGAAALLVPAARPYAWTMLLLVSIGVLWILGRDMSYKGWLLHLITFNPAWIPPRRDGIQRVFFDGSCGLCHASTRFLLAEDPYGAAFRYAPLDGKTSEELLSPAFPEGRPDSVVVLDESGRTFVQYKAVLRMGAALGGLWGALAALGRLLPNPLRAPAYNLVAKTRRWLSRQPETCRPDLTSDLIKRFDP
jgi:predicted DCC family thiol-disulfide oxidoreductase YuxK